MAATNVQAFSGDVEIASNVTAASSKFSLDTNGTLKQFGNENINYIKLMKYFDVASNWKIATGSYFDESYQWLSIRAKMTRLNEDVEIIQFNYFGTGGNSRVRDSIVIGGGTASTQANEIKVYNKTTNYTYEIYLQIDSATSVEVEITHRDSTIDDDYSTVAAGAIVEAGLTKIYDSGTTTDLRLTGGKVGIGTDSPGQSLHVSKVVAEGVNSILVSNPNGSANSSAALKLGVSSEDDTVAKFGIIHERKATYGCGDTYFCTNYANDTTEVSESDAAMTILGSNKYVGIGTTNPGAKMDVRGDSMIFDKANGDGASLSGLYNYTETQQLIDVGVVGGAGTITASTDIAPPPGTAGDVIAKFANTSGGEAVTDLWYPGPIPINNGTVIYFGVWIYATQNIEMQFFRFYDVSPPQNVTFNYTTPNKWVWFEKTITSDRSWNTSNFRFDNNTAGSIVYLTGVTIRVGQSQNTGLPFTPRYSPVYNYGPVFATQNLVAREAAIKILTGNVGIRGMMSPAAVFNVYSNDLGTTAGNSTDILKFGGNSGGAGALLLTSERLSNGSDWTTTGLRLQKIVDTTKMGFIQFGSSGSLTGELIFGNGDSTERMRITDVGTVGIGTNSPNQRLQVAGNVTLGSSSQGVFRPTFYYFQTYQALSGNARHFLDVNNTWVLVNNGQDKMYIRSDAGILIDDFTGQHRSFVENVWTENVNDYVGLIVSANKNTYTSASFATYKGNRAIQINESLPDVRLSNVAYDKSCFGVISNGEDPDSREDTYGSITVPIPKEKGDTRTFINSVGEGAIWVTNINGPLESGDYITTSNVAGYGQKQDSEFLANYTVAKITMDCDFNPQTQPVKQIKREMGNVDYWLFYRKEQISKEDYDVLPDTQRRIDSDDKYYQLFYEKEVTKDPLVYETEQHIWIHESREELVNSIDENGIFIWEDHPTETEKAYEIRYLDADGNITDEANHVYKAAFVGCTYHCG